MPAASAHPLTSQIIETEAQLRALSGEPAQLTCAKISNRLNSMTRLFVERSPFVCVATSDSAGHCELSPRGDPAGFVRILDNSTLLIPERPGNRLADSLRNVLANPHVDLLFIVPGVTDTFRVNGRATITTDTALLAPCAVESAERLRRPPRAGAQGRGFVAAAPSGRPRSASASSAACQIAMRCCAAKGRAVSVRSPRLM